MHFVAAVVLFVAACAAGIIYHVAEYLKGRNK